ncbi:MAG TPA: hypothetical protein VIO85_13215 [Candidatus Dormibacteraeota bacterium]|jgi:hypothetical protein
MATDSAAGRGRISRLSLKMPAKMTVDAFVTAKVTPEFQPIVAAIRNVMKECAPQAQEEHPRDSRAVGRR